MNMLSLFAGIGGLELGLERAGMTTVGQVELDPYCRRVLAKHWPEVPRHDDVRTAVEWWQSRPRPPVHVVGGGFPCQPISNAGYRLGQADPRWMWPQFAHIIRMVGPRHVVVENVAALTNRGLDIVLGDLADLGFDAEWSTVSACSVGAPHTRERLFVLAHAQGIGRERRGSFGPAAASVEFEGRGEEPLRPWSRGPATVGVAYGVPSRVDRLRGCGNAVVPAVGELIGRRLMDYARDEAAA